MNNLEFKEVWRKLIDKVPSISQEKETRFIRLYWDKFKSDYYDKQKVLDAIKYAHDKNIHKSQYEPISREMIDDVIKTLARDNPEPQKPREYFQTPEQNEAMSAWCKAEGLPENPKTKQERELLIIWAKNKVVELQTKLSINSKNTTTAVKEKINGLHWREREKGLSGYYCDVCNHIVHKLSNPPFYCTFCNPLKRGKLQERIDEYKETNEAK